jgi:DNA-binding CsgD family transcriptional regulator
MKQADFDRLVGLIYESALDPGLWQETMSVLARQVGADTFHLLGWDSKKQAATLGVMSHESWNDALALYNSYYGTVDPRRQLASRADPGVVLACHHHFDDQFISKSEFYQDFLLRYGLRYCLGGCLSRNESTDVNLALLRDPEHGPFEPGHESLLTLLMPHFNRSLRLMEHTQAATQSGELAAAGQDAASLAVIAVNRTGQLLYCNRNGEALLKAAETVRIRHGVLTCANESQEKEWDDILGGIVKTGRPANLLLNNSVKPDERYSVTLTPLPKRGAFSLTGEPDGVLCLIVPLDHRRMATAGQLMQLFGLSAAEARLARALAAGETLEFYALESDLKLPTVKSQLRSVFEKTGTDRQAALVRLIAGIPAVREPD